MGMGESTSWPACNRIIREWFPATERAFANAAFGAGSAAGPAFGTMAVTTVVGLFGWRISTKREVTTICDVESGITAADAT
jgi:MFS family permease